MINLKNLIIFMLITFFIYIVYDFFYYNIPKMIEPFDLSKIPPTFDINLNMATGGLEELNKQIENLQKKQHETQAKISRLRTSLEGAK